MDLFPAPTTLEEAIELLHGGLTGEEVDAIYEEPSEAWHNSVGRDLRNSWGLWARSPLAIHIMNHYGLGHADDMSGLILEGLRLKVRGEYFSPDLVAQVDKDFWVAKGVDPLTQEKIVLDKVG